jgi:hypothetical protein
MWFSNITKTVIWSFYCMNVLNIMYYLCVLERFHETDCLFLISAMLEIHSICNVVVRVGNILVHIKLGLNDLFERKM